MFFTKKEIEIESTDRISKFLEETSRIDWSCTTSDGWTCIFDNCTALIKGEIDYYYKSRKRNRATSFWFRLLALLFGTAGFIAPLLEATGLNQLKGIAPFGYLLLAISAAFFSANSLFGGTTGHARYVVTQLNLEKNLTLMVVEWGKIISCGSSYEIKADFIKEKMTDVYLIILNETDVWGKALAQEVDAYNKKVSQQAKDES